MPTPTAQAPRAPRPWRALAATLAALAPAGLGRPADAQAPPASLVVVARSINQERGPRQSWRVDYRLRNDSGAPLVAAPGDIGATVDGHVSNSRVPGLATPRRSTLAISGLEGMVACSEVIPSADEDRRCRERGLLQVWPAEAGDEPPDPISKVGARPLSPGDLPTLTVAPGGLLRVRLRLEHVQFLYGAHDPLLGRRTLDLRVGPAVVRDLLPLDRDRRRPPAASSPLPSPPADRLDRAVFVSAPDSLHLESHVPGNQYYKFERPVRYGTRMRLSYWYLVAPGTQGECRAQLCQHRNGTSWSNLPDGRLEQPLPVVGRWTRVERTFRTQPEATHLCIEFRISGVGDVGEMWVDDVALDALDEAPAAP